MSARTNRTTRSTAPTTGARPSARTAPGRPPGRRPTARARGRCPPCRGRGRSREAPAPAERPRPPAGGVEDSPDGRVQEQAGEPVVVRTTPTTAGEIPGSEPSVGNAAPPTSRLTHGSIRRPGRRRDAVAPGGGPVDPGTDESSGVLCRTRRCRLAGAPRAHGTLASTARRRGCARPLPNGSTALRT